MKRFLIFFLLLLSCNKEILPKEEKTMLHSVKEFKFREVESCMSDISDIEMLKSASIEFKRDRQMLTVLVKDEKDGKMLIWGQIILKADSPEYWKKNYADGNYFNDFPASIEKNRIWILAGNYELRFHSMLSDSLSVNCLNDLLRKIDLKKISRL
ncbi:MAG: hypothetical protein JXA60_08505 [Candidatus Coatesbacteria bacterium]|nr:hypothetical protein [Candidatus Coatesbacteria bacterium]